MNLKKILIVFGLIFLCSVQIANASIITEYQLFTVPAEKRNRIEKSVVKEILMTNPQNFYADKFKHTYFYTKNNNDKEIFSVFIKFYKNYDNTNIFIVTKPIYDEKSDIKNALERIALPYFEGSTQDIKPIYKEDYQKYILKNHLTGKFIDKSKKKSKLPQNYNKTDLKKVVNSEKTFNNVQIEKKTFKIEEKNSEKLFLNEYKVFNNTKKAITLTAQDLTPITSDDIPDFHYNILYKKEVEREIDVSNLYAVEGQEILDDTVNIESTEKKEAPVPEIETINVIKDTVLVISIPFATEKVTPLNSLDAVLLEEIESGTENCTNKLPEQIILKSGDNISFLILKHKNDKTPIRFVIIKNDVVIRSYNKRIKY